MKKEKEDLVFEKDENFEKSPNINELQKKKIIQEFLQKDNHKSNEKYIQLLEKKMESIEKVHPKESIDELEEYPEPEDEGNGKMGLSLIKNQNTKVRNQKEHSILKNPISNRKFYSQSGKILIKNHSEESFSDMNDDEKSFWEKFLDCIKPVRFIFDFSSPNIDENFEDFDERDFRGF